MSLTNDPAITLPPVVYNPLPWDPYVKTDEGRYSCQWDWYHGRVQFPGTPFEKRWPRFCDETRPHTHLSCMKCTPGTERMILGAVLADKDGMSWARCECCRARMFVGLLPIMAQGH